MRWLRVLVVCGVIGGATAASAQPGGGSGSGDPTAAKREKIKQRILAMRAWMLTQELGLDEATAGKLFPVLAKYDDRFAKLLKEGVELRRQAIDAAARGDDRALDAIVDKVVANQRARWDVEEARFKDVRKVLTAQQAARILVVLPQIDRKILRQIRRALGAGPGAGRGHGRGQGPPPASDDDTDPDDDLAPNPYE